MRSEVEQFEEKYKSNALGMHLRGLGYPSNGRRCPF